MQLVAILHPGERVWDADRFAERLGRKMAGSRWKTGYPVLPVVQEIATAAGRPYKAAPTAVF